jgi:hypothetical protein
MKRQVPTRRKRLRLKSLQRGQQLLQHHKMLLLLVLLWPMLLLLLLLLSEALWCAQALWHVLHTLSCKHSLDCSEVHCTTPCRHHLCFKCIVLVKDGTP